jgi:hypothetical protein
VPPETRIRSSETPATGARTETMPETHPPPPRPVMLADLNFEPAESDGEDRPPTPAPNPAAAAAAAAAPAVAADSSTK